MNPSDNMNTTSTPIHTATPAVDSATNEYPTMDLPTKGLHQERFSACKVETVDASYTQTNAKGVRKLLYPPGRGFHKGGVPITNPNQEYPGFPVDNS